MCIRDRYCSETGGLDASKGIRVTSGKGFFCDLEQSRALRDCHVNICADRDVDIQRCGNIHFLRVEIFIC